jgi:hypothetical protein
LFVALLALTLEGGLALSQRAMVSQGLRVHGGRTAQEIEDQIGEGFDVIA